MSATKLFLVLVFTDWNPNWREEFLLMDEESGVYEVVTAGIATLPYKRERHLFFELSKPLEAPQIAALEKNKGTGLFKDYFICQEVAAEDGTVQRTMIEKPALKDYWMMR